MFCLQESRLWRIIRIGSVLRQCRGCCVLWVSGTLWIGDSLMNLCEIRGFMGKGMLSPYSGFVMLVLQSISLKRLGRKMTVCWRTLMVWLLCIRVCRVRV